MQQFAFTAAVFEGSLVAVAILLGWLLGTPPLATFRFDVWDAAIGLAATVPPLGLFLFCLKCPLEPFRRIAEIMHDKLVPLFHDCRLVQLTILAAVAGVGEEMLFRGVIQTALAQGIDGSAGLWFGLVGAAVLFGLLHLITPTYAILAGVIGFYLGGLWLLSGNLIAPIVTHGVYDFVALVYLVQKSRHEPSTPERA